MNEEKELKYLQDAFRALLSEDKFYLLIRQGTEKKLTWAQVLKIAHDRSADFYRRHEYWNLHKYAELLGI